MCSKSNYIALETKVSLSGLASLGVAKRKRRSALEENFIKLISPIFVRNKRSTLKGPSGATVDTSSIDAEMVTFMTKNGATAIIVTWTEYVII